MILQGYFDESGTHHDSKALSVAGYLSTPERWIAFEDEWKGALRDYSLEFFHMADFANGAPPYESWTPEEKAERFERLVGIINRHALVSIGFTIPVHSYRFVVSAKAKKAGGGLYGIGANCCFMDAAEFLRENYPPAARVRYIFESGVKGAGEVLKNYQMNHKTPEQREHYRLSALSFEDKRLFCPLQAADILAYELYRQLPRQLGIDERSEQRRELAALSALPKRWWHLTESQLTNFAVVLEAYADFSKLSKRQRREILRRYPPWGNEGRT